MTDPMDADLSRAIKESAGKSLAGWEFTPAMQRRVLERIRADEDGAASVADRPSRRLQPNRFLRPLAWTAVAAAALLIAVNMDLGGMGGSAKKSVPRQDVASNKSGAPVPQAVAPKLEQQSGSASSAPAPAPATGAPAGGSPDSQSAPAKPEAPAEQKAAGAKPDQVATTSAPGTGGTVALELPTAAQTKGAPPMMGLMVATREKLSLQVTDGRAVELSLTGVRELDPDGAELWSYPVVGIAPNSLIAVSGDGSVALAADRQVQILSSDGKLQRTVAVSETVESMAWSDDGQLAVAHGPAVSVFARAGAVAQYHAPGVERPELAFSPEGMLAVLGSGQGGRQVSLYFRDGSELMHAAPVNAEARGILFTPGSLVAGGQAFDRQGRTLWQAPIRTDGLAPLNGTDLLVAWNASAVVALRSGDGIPVWQAAWSGPGVGLRKVVTSPDGRFLAVVAATEQGWALWILDQNGKVLYAERLADQPSDMAFVGGRLMLLMARGVEFRDFPH